MASLFRERLQFLEHVDALRAFVLMQQVQAQTHTHSLAVLLADSLSLALL